MKFKVGDRVRIRKDSEFYGYSEDNPKDKVGIIEDINLSMTLGVFVDWEELGSNSYEEEDLELAQVRNTKIARKMYPNHKVIDKDWIEKR